MKVILFISFFIGFNSKSVGKSALAESIETQKQRMKGFNSICGVIIICRCRQSGSDKLRKQLGQLDNRSGDLI